MATRGGAAVVPAIVALALAAGGCFAIEGEATCAIEIEMAIEASGVVRVSETIALSMTGDAGPPPLSRRFWVNPATFPLRQQVTGVAVTDGQGGALAFRRRAYGDWINLDLVEIPDGPAPTIRIDYAIERGLETGDGTATLAWSPIGLFWNAPVTRLALSVKGLDGVDPAAVSDEITVDYEERKGGTVEGGVYRWVYGERIEADQPVDWKLTFPRQAPAAPTSYAADLLAAAGVVPWMFGGLLLLALVLALVPPRLTVALAPLYNAVALATALAVLSWNAWYWWFEGRYRGGELDSIASEQVGFIGFLVVFVGYAVAQQRALRRGDSYAYFAQLALPVALALPAPMFSTNPALLFLPALGLPVLIFWLRPSIALQFGVGIDRVIEVVETEGEIDLASLAARAGVGERYLARILADRPGLPIVVDLAARRAFSPSVAALKRDLMICPACGGATQSRGMELLRCGYCDREYAASREARPRNPIPFSVNAIAAVLEMFGMLFVAWAAIILVVFLLLAIADSSVAVALVAAVVVVAPGIFLYGVAAKIRKGKRSVFLLLMYVALAPLVVPLLALRAESKNRVRLFYGTYPPARIGERVAEQGELSLRELAEMLETDDADAAEVARYLAGNDIIDAVFDRHGKRLVARDAYRAMASETSCQNCGGVLGVVDGRAACHYCGAAAA